MCIRLLKAVGMYVQPFNLGLSEWLWSWQGDWLWCTHSVKLACQAVNTAKA